MQRRTTLSLIGLVAVALPQSVAAESQRPQVSASVAESCRLDAPVIAISDSQQSANGFAWEACNSMRGYQIAATTRVLQPTEVIFLDYGSLSLQLDPNGTTKLVNRRGPILKQIPISLRAADLVSPLTLSVSMTVI